VGRGLNVNGGRARRATRAALALLLAAVAGCGGSAVEPAGAPREPAPLDAQEPVTLFVVRHAEKASGNDPDPELSAAGRARALALVEQLADQGVDAIIATELRRTQQTVQPLAERLALTVEVIAAAAGAALVERVSKAAPGTRIVVAGHSNTVPALIAALGVEEVVEIPEERYGELFVVRLQGGSAQLERRRFGD